MQLLFCDIIVGVLVYQRNYTIGNYTSAVDLTYGYYSNMSVLDDTDNVAIHSEFAFSIDEETFEEVQTVIEVKY